MDWNLRSCGRNGHVTYAPDEPELRSHLHTETPLGVAWRCLRCGDYVLGEPRGAGPADDAPQVRRGKALRDLVILRLLAVERGIRGLLVLLAAWGVYHFRGAASRGGIQRALDEEIPILKQAADVFHIKLNLENSSMVDTIRKILEADTSTITWVAVGLAAYGILQLVEGTGLWLLKRWGEYFAVVATSLGLPIEIYELTEKITWVRIVALLINVAAVLYLLMSKRLFGLRGGHAAYEAERHEANLLEVEVAAEATKMDRRSIRAVTAGTSSAPVD
jgi:uncharacterized membrane protein (DUF2068 family)